MRAPALARLSALTALLAAAVMSTATPARSVSIIPATYVPAVAQICAHALMFEGRHSVGTRAGALEVAVDIRASTRRRLALVAAVPVAPARRAAVARWIALERRLADTYALDYVRIFDLIAAPRPTDEETRRAARRLANLIHAPDRLRRDAMRLEQVLRVPDCTGG